ncbi:MAG TPA: hypothetical protein VK832_00870, partial [Burkholderiaceae bacterium]|nr:hypothetical protein [Burkholderiaceae bacterium]
MRRGYWRTLIRRLRAKVASGESTFFHPDGVFSISTVNAVEEATLEEGDELRLADDEQGNFLMVDVATARVAIVYPNSQRLLVNEDLVGFIDALRSLVPPGMELGPIVDETIDL